MNDQVSDHAHSDTPASQGTGYLIWRVVNLWQKTQKETLAQFDLTPVQFLLLSGLAELSPDDAAIKQSTLAQHCRTDAMMTSQVIRSLEKRGLVRRTRHRQDRRAVSIVLTEEGGSAVNDAE
ncbi:MAG TPA: MarR family transcriptional regulator, partial [Rhodospirillaceae bacterium]|nr:MarR family transcriptional regulator [Rhodospirillaceae bacterium]